MELAPGATQTADMYPGSLMVARTLQGQCAGIVQIAAGTGQVDFLPEAAATGNRGKQAAGQPQQPGYGQPQPQPTPQPAPPQQTAGASNCHLIGSVKSAANGGESFYTIFNDGVGMLHIYWIDQQGQASNYQGQGQPLAIIAPGTGESLQAAIGFVYAATDSAGDCLSVFQSSQTSEQLSFAPTK